MSLVFQLVLVLLITEISVFVLLTVPLPLAWRKLFLRTLNSPKVYEKLRIIFIVLYSLVGLLFAESLQRSFSLQGKTSLDHNRDLGQSLQLKLFYAQRNLYLTLFTLFLAYAINRYINILLELNRHEEKSQIVKKQATQQGSEYQRLIDDLTSKERQIESLKTKVEDDKKKVLNAEAALKQAKSINEEYMRLADRNNELEKKLLKETDKSK